MLRHADHSRGSREPSRGSREPLRGQREAPGGQRKAPGGQGCGKPCDKAKYAASYMSADSPDVAAKRQQEGIAKKNYERARANLETAMQATYKAIERSVGGIKADPRGGSAHGRRVEGRREERSSGRQGYSDR